MDPIVNIPQLDKGKDIATNILLITCFLVVIMMLFLIFYPLCVRRPLNAWLERRRHGQKRNADNEDGAEPKPSAFKSSLI